jgi:hypothetical protein
VRNGSVNFRRSSGIYEYLMTLVASAQIVIGLSLLIFLYAMPHLGAQATHNVMAKSSVIEGHIERYVAKLEQVLQPLE